MCLSNKSISKQFDSLVVERKNKKFEYEFKNNVEIEFPFFSFLTKKKLFN